MCVSTVLVLFYTYDGVHADIYFFLFQASDY